MRLFVSSGNVDEAMVVAAAAQYVDQVDVTKPDKGSTGGNYPWVIKAIREATPAGQQVSAALGDAPFKPGALAQAAAPGAACITVGLFSVAAPDQASSR
jgi:(5-formylfuran-3-yl)methyl phosphate synthase